MSKSDLEDIMTTIICIVNQAPCMPAYIKSKGGVSLNSSNPRSISLCISGINNIRKSKKYIGGCYMASWQFRLSYISMCKSDDEKIRAQALMSYFSEWLEGYLTHDEYGNQTDKYIEEFPLMSDGRELSSIRELRNPYVAEVTSSGLTIISTEYEAAFLVQNNHLWRQNAK